MHNRNGIFAPLSDFVYDQGSPWTGQDPKQVPPTYSIVTQIQIFTSPYTHTHKSEIFEKMWTPYHWLLELYHDRLPSLLLAYILGQPVAQKSLKLH